MIVYSSIMIDSQMIMIDIQNWHDCTPSTRHNCQVFWSWTPLTLVMIFMHECTYKNCSMELTVLWGNSGFCCSDFTHSDFAWVEHLQQQNSLQTSSMLLHAAHSQSDWCCWLVHLGCLEGYGSKHLYSFLWRDGTGAASASADVTGLSRIWCFTEIPTFVPSHAKNFWIVLTPRVNMLPKVELEWHHPTHDCLNKSFVADKWYQLQICCQVHPCSFCAETCEGHLSSNNCIHEVPERFLAKAHPFAPEENFIFLSCVVDTKVTCFIDTPMSEQLTIQNIRLCVHFCCAIRYCRLALRVSFVCVTWLTCTLTLKRQHKFGTLVQACGKDVARSDMLMVLTSWLNQMRISLIKCWLVLTGGTMIPQASIHREWNFGGGVPAEEVSIVVLFFCKGINICISIRIGIILQSKVHWKYVFEGLNVGLQGFHVSTISPFPLSWLNVWGFFLVPKVHMTHAILTLVKTTSCRCEVHIDDRASVTSKNRQFCCGLDTCWTDQCGRVTHTCIDLEGGNHVCWAILVENFTSMLMQILLVKLAVHASEVLIQDCLLDTFSKVKALHCSTTDFFVNTTGAFHHDLPFSISGYHMDILQWLKLPRLLRIVTHDDHVDVIQELSPLKYTMQQELLREGLKLAAFLGRILNFCSVL